ncbi:GntR family transcriptional regulator [Acetoanaerobium noterae]|uniref:GntR family transcriptional regulator n=1 Tax=Acetoanaerobium noterae TaxID=745369 RepID=A0A1T4ZT76_9FIRM|nr:GntR family transcriptional regulator [Acetoanaerobium noterae]MBP8762428.1 GntR family transcriptional regulator [Acetoanaerobium sp.]MBP9499864.1 GntR family transcriptional regulator [Acetoanaerobium sp.]MBP9562087.1 GntR family transcriptional regulator [Acetoanaerobium sp.]SKB25523.1 GntR family transcriptional regulator [Acetoanaerobium noterae]
MFKIDMRSRTPIYEQIIDSIKELVVKGVLIPGERLPSVRDMAKEMTLNPNTVQKAYQELERQGIISTLRGKGTFISEDIQANNKILKRSQLMEELKKLVVEAIYLDLSKDELIDYIKDIYDDIVIKG